jgi:hypothetical protein
MSDFLPFELGDDIATAEDEEFDYVVEQLLVREAITAFTAKIKAGKTTFTGHLLSAIFNNQPVMCFDTRPAKVLYCTEEGKKTFRSFLNRTGLANTGGQLEVLRLSQVPKVFDWPSIVDGVLAHALRVNADLVVFDTISRWAKIKPEMESDAGTAAMVMEPLERLRAARLAVLAIFHERKSGGDISDATRGSSAFGGAADILLTLTNPGTNGHPNRRVLEMLGRFDDPGTWTIEMVDGKYVVQNEDGSLDVERSHTKMMIDLYLGSGPLTRDALATVLGVSPNSGTFRRALEDMASERQIVREGSGRKGDPFTYLLNPLEKGASQ